MLSIKKNFIKFFCLFLPRVQREQFKCLSNDNSFFSIKKKNKLYYDKNFNNFGDFLNEDLMNYFKCDYTRASHFYSNFCCIGSILEAFLSNRKTKKTEIPIKIFGSGFIKKEEIQIESFYRPVQIYALRGKLTQERCEKILKKELSGIPLGDPGLLIRKIFADIPTNPQVDVGIICHYADTSIDVDRRIELDGLSHKFISTSLPTSEFVKEVASCSVILSSALHGLVCADALLIPNRHILLSNHLIGGTYKFEDYYSAYSKAKYACVDLRNDETKINNNLIRQIQDEYNVSAAEIDTICAKLEQAFLVMSGSSAKEASYA